MGGMSMTQGGRAFRAAMLIGFDGPGAALT
jgi:hypothetical protein